MEDIRSNPEEESPESPGAREEMETLDEATHEAEARVEKIGGYKEAEVIEGLVKGMVKGSPETVDPTKSPGGAASETEGARKVEDGDKSDLIDIPDTKKVDIAATPLPIPKDEIGTTPKGQPNEITMDEEPPHSLEAEKIGEKIGENEPTPVDLPDTKGVHIAASPLPIPKDEIGTTPIDHPNLSSQDVEPPHGGGADGIALDNPEVKKIALDNPEVNEVGSTQEEAMVGTAPTEMPPEMDNSGSEEMAGFKFYKPIPAMDGKGMVKGWADLEPDLPAPESDIRPDEVVGMKFHPGEEITGSVSPGIDQVAKVDSFTREVESDLARGEEVLNFEAPPVAEASETEFSKSKPLPTKVEVPNLELPPTAEITEERDFSKKMDDISKDPAYLKAQDEVSKDPAYLEASELDIADADSNPPEGDEIEEDD